MGAYAYCQHPGCDYGFDKPTAAEVIDGERQCGAGHSNPVFDTKDNLIIELDARVAEIERRLEILSPPRGW